MTARGSVSMTARYAVSLHVTVEFDAETDADATQVAARLADSVSVAAPLGRGAELVRFTHSPARPLTPKEDPPA